MAFCSEIFRKLQIQGRMDVLYSNLAYKVLKSRSRGAQLRLTLGPSLKVQFRLAPSSEAQLRQEIPIDGRAVELDFGLVQDITYGWECIN